MAGAVASDFLVWKTGQAYRDRLRMACGTDTARGTGKRVLVKDGMREVYLR